MAGKDRPTAASVLKKDDQIVTGGAGGFIAVALTRHFFSSSACAYNVELEKDPNCLALKESDAYPAMAERGYGREVSREC